MSLPLPLHAHCPLPETTLVSARFIPGIPVPVPNPFQPVHNAINTFIRKARQVTLGIFIYFITGIKNTIIYGFIVYYFDPNI